MSNKGKTSDPYAKYETLDDADKAYIEQIMRQGDERGRRREKEKGRMNEIIRRRARRP